MSNPHPIIKALQEELAKERNDEMTAFELCTGPVGYRIGHEAATARLLGLLEKAIELANYYANSNGIFADSEDCDISDSGHEYGGKKAREFLSELSKESEKENTSECDQG